MNTSLPNSLQLIPQYQAPSSWWEHVPVAHWLVETLQPDSVVELGSHYGVSFFAFCEAAKAYSEQTFVYAIDTWEGDRQAGFYGDDVYEMVESHQRSHHKQRSRLIRSTFDEAASHFPENSVDIIHIDGLHTYEAVRHDYENWLPKLKEGGSLLFHDWNVREEDFGVWKLWQEVKQADNLHCIDIRNGHGLGVATLSSNKPMWHHELENILPMLTAKGALLSQLDELREQLTAIRKELVIAKQHGLNLSTMKEEAMAQTLEKDRLLEEQRKVIEYLRKSRLRSIANKLLNRKVSE